MRTDHAHRYRILLADDQPDIRDALRLLLKNEGYETQPAASPAEALAAIENRHKVIEKKDDGKKPTLRRTSTTDKNGRDDKGNDDDRPTLKRRDDSSN